jgi:hypothetical protein
MLNEEKKRLENVCFRTPALRSRHAEDGEHARRCVRDLQEGRGIEKRFTVHVHGLHYTFTDLGRTSTQWCAARLSVT